VAAIVVVSTLAGCGKAPEKEAHVAAPVRVAAAETGTIARVIEADGILRAIDQAAVTPKIASPVRKFLVNRGDRVKQGQLLAVLESRDLAAAAADAKNAYEQAAANYRNVARATVPDEVVKARTDVDASRQQADAAKKLVESREQLYKDGALARRQVDEAQVAYAQAKAQFETALAHLSSVQQHSRHEEVRGAQAQMESFQAKWDAAKAQLSYAEIHSPVSGVIADRPLYAGEMAQPGTPLLTVVDASSVIAKVNIAQEQAAFLKIGQKARITAAGGAAEAAGKVTVVSPAIDAQSTTVEVWVQAPNPGETLRPGATVHVTIDAGSVAQAVIVPTPALLPSDEGVTVLVVGADNVAHAKKVKAGVRNAQQTQILAGVEAGQRVVVEGGVGLDEGALVRILPAKSEDADKDEKDGKAGAAHE
jgi:multidrug efflux pump subunit AcrA (membrane-fusion protein)